MLVLIICFVWSPATVMAAGVPVALFPQHDANDGWIGANLPLTSILAERLADNGNGTIDLQKTIDFMAYNRIRTPVYRETFYVSQARNALRPPLIMLASSSPIQNFNFIVDELLPADWFPLKKTPEIITPRPPEVEVKPKTEPKETAEPAVPKKSEPLIFLEEFYVEKPEPEVLEEQEPEFFLKKQEPEVLEEREPELFLKKQEARQPAAVQPIALFPLHDVDDGWIGANLPLTRMLADELADNGYEIIDLDTVITFMAENRIRTPGYLETFYISLARNVLGAPFLLLGTVTHRKEGSKASLGLTLNLVRTRDAKTMWTHVSSFSVTEEPNILGIGEPRSSKEVLPILLDEIIGELPSKSINGEQSIKAADVVTKKQPDSPTIDTVVVTPRYARPDDEIHCRLRLRNTWPEKLTPQLFFKVNDQLYPATVSADSARIYEGTWTAGEESDRVSVFLVARWPQYNRSEPFLLNFYTVDETPPFYKLTFNGVKKLSGHRFPVFYRELEIIPSIINPEIISKWRLTISNERGEKMNELIDKGSVPPNFSWRAGDEFGSFPAGTYIVELETWDLAGNSAQTDKEVELDRTLPRMNVQVKRRDKYMTMKLRKIGSILPITLWQLDLWTEEGRVLTQTEGEKLPAEINVELPDFARDKKIQGILTYIDGFGRGRRLSFRDLFPETGKRHKGKPKKAKAEAGKKKPEGVSESWVDEF